MGYIFPPSYDTQPEPDDDDEETEAARHQFAALIGQTFLELIGENEARFLLDVLDTEPDELQETVAEYLRCPD